MRAKVLTLRFSPQLGRFDDAPLTRDAFYAALRVNDLVKAREYQAKSVQFIQILLRQQTLAASKEMMKFVGMMVLMVVVFFAVGCLEHY